MSTSAGAGGVFGILLSETPAVADIYAELKRGAPLLHVSYLPGKGPGWIAALLRDAKPGDLIIAYGVGFGAVTPVPDPGYIVSFDPG